jgi:hypothetical protein
MNADEFHFGMTGQKVLFKVEVMIGDKLGFWNPPGIIKYLRDSGI